MKSVSPNTPYLTLPHLKVSEVHGIRNSLVSSASSILKIDAIFLIIKGRWRVLVNFLKVLEPLLSLLQTPGRWWTSHWCWNRYCNSYDSVSRLLQILQCNRNTQWRRVLTHSGGNDYVPASDGRAARLADGVDTEKLPALCGGGYVLTRVGETKDVQLQYVYFSCVYEFCWSRRRTWNLSIVNDQNILQQHYQPCLWMFNYSSSDSVWRLFGLQLFPIFFLILIFHLLGLFIVLVYKLEMLLCFPIHDLLLLVYLSVSTALS